MPSVYAARELQTTSARCQPEHQSSTAFVHVCGFDRVLELEEFSSVAKNGDQAKPIVLAFVDGGPDENLQFSKVLSVAIDHFRKYKLDVHIAMTHAPGMLAYNYVKRRMTLFSKALAGVVLNHGACRTRLDESGCTKDV